MPACRCCGRFPLPFPPFSPPPLVRLRPSSTAAEDAEEASLAVADAEKTSLPLSSVPEDSGSTAARRRPASVLPPSAALKKADPTFTDAELRTLADSLVANRKAREAKAKAARDARAAEEAMKKEGA